MNPQGAGAKIKEISHKIILKFLIQGLHHPYTLPSKGEIVPPISIKLQNVLTVAIDDLPPHGNTHCPVPNNCTFEDVHVPKHTLSPTHNFKSPGIHHPNDCKGLELSP